MIKDKKIPFFSHYLENIAVCVRDYENKRINVIMSLDSRRCYLNLQKKKNIKIVDDSISLENDLRVPGKNYFNLELSHCLE